MPIEVIVRAKDAEENAKQIEQCIDIVKKSGVCRGYNDVSDSR